MSLPVVIIGAGGHGRVVADTLAAMGRAVSGFIDIDSARWGSTVNGLPVIGGDDALSASDTGRVELANGVGSVASLDVRRAVFERFHARSFRFATLIHPGAVVSGTVRLGEGAQIMAGAVLQANAGIGENTIVNTGALVDHDCVVGAHCHIAPGCVLSGGVHVGDATHLGTAAAVIQGIRIGAGVTVGAGAVVVEDVAPGKRVTGVPAREARPA